MSWRSKLWTKWAFGLLPSQGRRWALSLPPRTRRESRGGPFGPIYCEFCATARTSWESFCGRESDALLNSCFAVAGTLFCSTPEICLDLFWPPGMPSRFEGLDIETIIVATNYLDRSEVAYDAGPLRPAVAGSMAIPGLFRPVMFGDGVLIDGGAVNPLPYDLLFGLAVEVSI